MIDDPARHDHYLRRCLELAGEALEAGDEPFGSLLVDADGRILFEARNRETTLADPTAHPELELAQWAARHLDAGTRAAATAYTSGEHCPMCAAAHGWVGLGAVVFAASSAQLSAWRSAWGLPEPAVAPLSMAEIALVVPTTGPVPPFDEQIRALHEQAAGRDSPDRS